MALEIQTGKYAVESYRRLCEKEGSNVPLFCQAWWLDMLAGEEGWDAVIVEQGGVIQAALPYVVNKRFGFSFVTQPQLTQHLGPWIRPIESSSASRLAREKDLMESLIEGLPAFGRFFQNWSYELTNWLPFFWQGYQQTTRYTYVIRNIQDHEALWKGLRENIRREIKKAQSRYALTIRTDLSVEEFYKLNRMVFARQNKRVPYSKSTLVKLDSECARRGARRIFIAEDSEGRHHAAVYMVWDERSAYYLMGGGDPVLRNSGAASLCMWEAIKFAGTVSNQFDFEGSMLESVERFFRGFGAEQLPYHSVTRIDSRLLKIAYFLRDFLR